MTDPAADDDALTWAGDEQPHRPAPVVRAASVATPGSPGGALGLVVLGVLGGVAALETVGWVRSVLSTTLAATLDTGRGDALAMAAFAVNVLGRAAAVAAPILWFTLAAWRVRAPIRRLAWLVLGALLLVPWPALLGLA
jgi:hypothetical protein